MGSIVPGTRQAIAYSPIYTSFLGSIDPGTRQAIAYSFIYTFFWGSIDPGREYALARKYRSWERMVILKKSTKRARVLPKSG